MQMLVKCPVLKKKKTIKDYNNNRKILKIIKITKSNMYIRNI